jgi:adenylate cyclase
VTEAPDPAELERLGVYDPAAPGAADRLHLLTKAFELGATVDEVIGAVRAKGINSLVLDLTMRPPGTTQRFGEFVEHSGLDPHLARRLWLAFGLPDSDHVSVRVTPDAAEALRFTAGMTPYLGEDVVLALARVVGSSVARIAEALSGAFRIGIETPQLLTGVPEAQVVESFAADARDVLPLFLDTVAAMFRRHVVLVSYQLWSTDEERAAVTLDRTVGFADLVGSTGVLRAQSVRETADMVRGFEEQVWELVIRAGGRVVKLIGDEAMFVLADTDAACDVALALIDASPHPVRVGLARGPVVQVYGDYYGETVNLAARLVNEAPPGTLLVSEAVRDRAGASFTFEPRGPLRLKGFTEPTPVFGGIRSS